ncbi:hypothetical protein [Halorarius halobius]|uniref:hypothetical protein n=1 Tax=Halorarius halobius TaxID=2962671 RepID=UPI0020CBF8B3|nr:hypothetical protein [Halorarius halobius]
MAERQRSVPLEHVAPVYVESEDGYVNVQQGHGDHTLYTPDEVRELAEELLDAADDAER